MRNTPELSIYTHERLAELLGGQAVLARTASALSQAAQSAPSRPAVPPDVLAIRVKSRRADVRSAMRWSARPALITPVSALAFLSHHSFGRSNRMTSLLVPRGSSSVSRSKIASGSRPATLKCTDHAIFNPVADLMPSRTVPVSALRACCFARATGDRRRWRG